MTASNLIIHRDLTFEQYLQMPGNSFSGLKANGKVFTPTIKMRLGTQVHQYLTDETAFTGDVRIIKPLAMALKSAIGSLWEHLQHRICVTCDFEHENFVMPYKGEIDSGIVGRIVLDYKIGERVRRSMDYFGYKNQLAGYATAINAPLALIIAINPKEYNPKPDIIPVNIDTSWWCEKVLLNGQITQQ